MAIVTNQPIAGKDYQKGASIVRVLLSAIMLSARLILPFALMAPVLLTANAQMVKVVAVVNGEAITNFELNSRLDYLVAATGEVWEGFDPWR